MDQEILIIIGFVVLIAAVYFGVPWIISHIFGAGEDAIRNAMAGRKNKKAAMEGYDTGLLVTRYINNPALPPELAEIAERVGRHQISEEEARAHVVAKLRVTDASAADAVASVSAAAATASAPVAAPAAAPAAAPNQVAGQADVQVPASVETSAPAPAADAASPDATRAVAATAAQPVATAPATTPAAAPAPAAATPATSASAQGAAKQAGTGLSNNAKLALAVVAAVCLSGLGGYGIVHAAGCSKGQQAPGSATQQSFIAGDGQGAGLVDDSTTNSIDLAEESAAADADSAEESGNVQDSLPEGAVYIDASQAGNDAPPPEFSKTSVSSIAQEDLLEGEEYSGSAVLDGDPATAWNSDGRLSSDGSGQWIELMAQTDQTVHGVRIMPGFCKDEKAWSRNRRPKDITITLSDGTSFTATLEDVFATYQDIEFPGAFQTQSLFIEINSTYAPTYKDGNVYDDCCISEIEAY